MKLEVGMYVRTNEGLIGKITWCCCKNEECNKWVFTLDITGEFEYSYLLLDKEPSFNPIELIEKGDYANGEKVFEVLIDRNMSRVKTELSTFFESDIKSIVTKEQFESMSYKVGE